MKWKNRGLDVTMETDPHYLAFDYSMWKRIGIYGKVNPPLRGPEDRKFLINGISKRMLDSISTDTNTFTKVKRQMEKISMGIFGMHDQDSIIYN
ncbi:MAG: hypothetical protein QW752_04035 [Thermoplasmata archaeon]